MRFLMNKINICMCENCVTKFPLYKHLIYLINFKWIFPIQSKIKSDTGLPYRFLNNSKGANELPHDITNKMSVRPVKTQISLGICPLWSESLLSAWRKLGSLATHWAHSEDSDQTGQMPRLIWVFAGSTVTLLVLSHHLKFLFKL